MKRHTCDKCEHYAPTGEWLDPFDDVPSWRETGETVEAELTNGVMTGGTLDQYDMTPGPDEEPLFRLKTAEAELSWFDDIKRFRYAP